MVRRRGISKRRRTRRLRTNKRRTRYHQGRKRTRAYRMRGGKRRRSRKRKSRKKLFGGADEDKALAERQHYMREAHVGQGAADRKEFTTNIRESEEYKKRVEKQVSENMSDEASRDSANFMEEITPIIKKKVELIIDHTSLTNGRYSNLEPDIALTETQSFLNKLLYACDLAQEYNPETANDYLNSFVDDAYLAGQLTQYVVFCVGCAAAFKNTNDAEQFFEQLLANDRGKNYRVQTSNLYKHPNEAPPGGDISGNCNPESQIGFNKTLSKLLTSIGSNNTTLSFMKDDAKIDTEQLTAWDNMKVRGLAVKYYKECKSIIEKFDGGLVFTVEERSNTGNRPEKKWIS